MTLLWDLLCPDLVVPYKGDVLRVDTQLVMEIAACCQCPRHHAQLFPCLHLG